MMREELRRKMELAMSKTDAAESPTAGEWTVSEAPMFDPGHEPQIMVGRSLRLPIPTFDQITEIARQRGMTTSQLMRTWISEGIARADEEAAAPDLPSIVRRLRTAVDAAEAVVRRSAA